VAAVVVMAVIGVSASGVLLYLARPRPLRAPEHDTDDFERLGPADGELVRVKGRVVVDEPVRAPSGCACALYELYVGESGAPARALRQRGVAFLVDDGVTLVRVDPAYKLVAFDLPTAVVEAPHTADRFIVERRLQPGARVEVVGRLWHSGAPGHAEAVLLPADVEAGVAVTFLEA
jgi:hypothetical protein